MTDQPTNRQTIQQKDGYDGSGHREVNFPTRVQCSLIRIIPKSHMYFLVDIVHEHTNIYLVACLLMDESGSSYCEFNA